MVKKQPDLLLSKSPNSKKVLAKLALGFFLITFFLTSELIIPSLRFLPIVLAQDTSPAPTSIPETNTPLTFQLPFSGYLSQSFSTYHPGVDLATGLGMPIKPIAKGVVTKAGYEFWGYGLKVEIDHPNGYHSLYAHLGQIYVQVGQTVDVNDYIGEVGLTGKTTGPHTHLEVSKDNYKIDPLNVLPEVRRFPQPQDFVKQDGAADPIVENAITPENATASAQINPTYYPTPTPKPLSPEDVSLEQTQSQPILKSLSLNPTKEITQPSQGSELDLTAKLVSPSSPQDSASSFQGGSYIPMTLSVMSAEIPNSSEDKVLSQQTAEKMDLTTILSKKSKTEEQKTKITSQLSLLP